MGLTFDIRIPTRETMEFLNTVAVVGGLLVTCFGKHKEMEDVFKKRIVTNGSICKQQSRYVVCLYRIATKFQKTSSSNFPRFSLENLVNFPWLRPYILYSMIQTTVFYEAKTFELPTKRFPNSLFSPDFSWPTRWL